MSPGWDSVVATIVPRQAVPSLRPIFLGVEQVETSPCPQQSGYHSRGERGFWCVSMSSAVPAVWAAAEAKVTRGEASSRCVPAASFERLLIRPPDPVRAVSWFTCPPLGNASLRSSAIRYRLAPLGTKAKAGSSRRTAGPPWVPSARRGETSAALSLPHKWSLSLELFCGSGGWSLPPFKAPGEAPSCLVWPPGTLGKPGPSVLASVPPGPPPCHHRDDSLCACAQMALSPRHRAGVRPTLLQWELACYFCKTISKQGLVHRCGDQDLTVLGTQFSAPAWLLRVTGEHKSLHSSRSFSVSCVAGLRWASNVPDPAHPECLVSESCQNSSPGMGAPPGANTWLSSPGLHHLVG